MDLTKFGNIKIAEDVLGSGGGTPPASFPKEEEILKLATKPPQELQLTKAPMPPQWLARLKQIALKLHEEIEEGKIEMAKSTSNYLQGFLDSVE